MTYFHPFTALVSILFLVAACGDEPAEVAAPDSTSADSDVTEDISITVSYLLSERAELSLFLDILEDTDLLTLVNDSRGMIVIAPTNTALEALPGDALATLRSP
ncbi:MAG: hypothetical protein AAGA69_05395, partial [Pseudomonadota bacterium]